MIVLDLVFPALCRPTREHAVRQRPSISFGWSRGRSGVSPSEHTRQLVRERGENRRRNDVHGNGGTLASVRVVSVPGSRADGRISNGAVGRLGCRHSARNVGP